MGLRVGGGPGLQPPPSGKDGLHSGGDHGLLTWGEAWRVLDHCVWPKASVCSPGPAQQRDLLCGSVGCGQVGCTAALHHCLAGGPGDSLSLSGSESFCLQQECDPSPTSGGTQQDKAMGHGTWRGAVAPRSLASRCRAGGTRWTLALGRLPSCLPPVPLLLYSLSCRLPARTGLNVSQARILGATGEKLSELAGRQPQGGDQAPVHGSLLGSRQVHGQPGPGLGAK